MSVNSCTVAVVSNYSIQIANMNADITKKMNMMTSMKAYKVAEYEKNSLISNATSRINATYSSGNKILRSYPGIPQSVLNSVGIQNSNDVNFYNTNISLNGEKKSCSGNGGGVCCISSSNILDNLCCACRPGHSFCNSCGNCNINPDQYGCDAFLSTNFPLVACFQCEI